MTDIKTAVTEAAKTVETEAVTGLTGLVVHHPKTVLSIIAGLAILAAIFGYFAL